MVLKFLRRVMCAVPLLGATALTLVACSGTSSGDTDSSTVKWAVIIPSDWDPVLTSSHYPQYYTNLVYEPLLEIDKQGQPAPGLAESWNFNSDGTALTLNLRQGGEFTDGTPVDAVAVKAFFDRALTEDSSARKVDFDSIDHATVDSKWKVTLHLKRPNYSLLLRLGPKAGQIPSPAADPASLKQKPVGAGPYKVTEFVDGDHVYLVKNPDYWDAANIKIPKINLYATPGPAAAVASITSGQYDLVDSIDTAEQKSAEGVDGIKIFNPAGNNEYYLDLNVTIAPFNDPAVVKAFALAINRQEFIDKAVNGIGQLSTQPYQPNELGYLESYSHPEFNPDKAKQILAAAGYRPGDIKLTIPVTSSNQPKAEALQDQLQAIGGDSRIQVLQTANLTKEQLAKSRKYPLFISGTHNYVDPLQTFSQQFSAKGNVNVSGVQPRDFDELIAQAQATPLDSPRYRDRVNAVAASALGFGSKIYLFTYHYAYLQSTRISDFPRTPGSVSWKGVTVAS